MSLTRDVLSIIFKFLKFDEVKTIYRVNKVFNKACQMDSLWELWAKQEFGEVDLNLDSYETTWKAFFKTWWIGRQITSKTLNKKDSLFYNRVPGRACKFVEGDQNFVKFRHGDITENKSMEWGIWHKEKGLMELSVWGQDIR